MSAWDCQHNDIFAFLHELIPTHPLHPRAQFRLNMMPPFASRHSGRQSRSPSSEQEQGQEHRHVHGWAQAGKRMRAQRDAGRGPATDAAPGCPAASPSTHHCHAPRVLACRALREAAGPARIARAAKSSCWQVVSARPPPPFRALGSVHRLAASIVAVVVTCK